MPPPYFARARSFLLSEQLDHLPPHVMTVLLVVRVPGPRRNVAPATSLFYRSVHQWTTFRRNLVLKRFTNGPVLVYYALRDREERVWRSMGSGPLRPLKSG